MYETVQRRNHNRAVYFYLQGGSREDIIILLGAACGTLQGGNRRFCANETTFRHDEHSIYYRILPMEVAPSCRHHVRERPGAAKTT
jgi:hypothetical protein